MIAVREFPRHTTYAPFSRVECKRSADGRGERSAGRAGDWGSSTLEKGIVSGISVFAHHLTKTPPDLAQPS
eukprot:6188746-Pleurochrysis_carterae.AAC.2